MSLPGEPEPKDSADPVERWLDPFFSEPALWPVLLVLVLSLVTFGAAAILVALSGRSAFSAVALLALAAASAEAVWRSARRRRRLGRLGGLILALWGLSLGLAAGARLLGIF